jgi:hypothetical protein
VRPLGNGRELRLRASRVVEDAALGDSIAIDGACHTVTSLLDDGFTVQSVATTLGRTTLGGFGPGRRVNLERSHAVRSRRRRHRGHPRGRMVIVADDEDRENEGDLVCAASSGHAGDHQLHGHPRPRADLPRADAGARRRAGPPAHGRRQHRGAGHRLHRLGGRGAHFGVTTGISAWDRAKTIQVCLDPGGQAVGPAPARPRLPAARAPRRRAPPRRPDRGLGGPRAHGGAPARRRDLRDPQRRRLHGAPPGAGALRARARAPLHHRGADHRAPPAARAAGHREAEATSPPARRLARGRVPQRRRPARARRARQGRGRGPGGRARAHALRVPHRRRLPLAALRLRRAARRRDAHDRPRPAPA